MQGDSETKLFNRVYDETYDSVMRFILSRTGDYNATNDLLQEVYKAFYIRICNRGSKDIRDYKAFLMTSAANAIKGHFLEVGEKRQDINLDGLKSVSLEVLEKELSERLPGVEDSFINRDLSDQVLGYLEEKGGGIKKLFVYHFFCGLTIKEAAQKLEIKQSDAVNLIYRTIKDIRRRLVI